MINALIWNARGVGNPLTIHHLKRLVRCHSLSLLVLFEPFVENDRLDALKDKLHCSDFRLSNNKKICVM